MRINGELPIRMAMREHRAVVSRPGEMAPAGSGRLQRAPGGRTPLRLHGAPLGGNTTRPSGPTRGVDTRAAAHGDGGWRAEA